MLFVVAFLIVFGTSLLVALTARLRSLSATIAAILVFQYAEIVLVGEIAALLDRANSPWLFFACHLAAFAIAFGVWYKAGKPLSMDFARLRQGCSALAQPEIALLALGVGVAYLVGAWLVYEVPPNTGDSMGTYMGRVGQWVTRGSLDPWNTGNWPQIAYPINPQLQVLWTVVFWGTDQLSGGVQWMAALAGVVAVFGLARVIGATLPQALLSALTWATLPQILLQSTSTQTDLTMSSLFVASVFFLFLGMRGSSGSALWVSALALALAAGTKHTIAFFVPGLGVALLAYWFGTSRAGRRLLLSWAAACVVAFFLFGSYAYIQNLLIWGNPIGPPEVGLSALTGSESSVEQPTWVGKMVILGGRYSYQFFDVTGLPDPVANRLQLVKERIAGPVFELLRIPVSSKIGMQEYAQSWDFLRWRPMVHEHNAWFGPLTVLLLIPALFFNSYDSLRKRDWYRVSLVCGFVCLTLYLCALRPWGGTEGRYFMLGVTACWPLTFVMFRPSLPGRLFTASVVLVALVVVGWTTLTNELKPLRGPDAIWRVDRRSRQARYFRTLLPTVRSIDRIIPPKARIGYVRFEVGEYFLFGPQLLRTVVPVYPAERIHDRDWIRNQKLDAILYCTDRVGAIAVPDYQTVAESEGFNGCECALLAKTSGGSALATSSPIRAALLGVSETPEEAPLFVVEPPLRGRVGVGHGVCVPDWGIEKISLTQSILWLGSGSKDGVRTSLWSDAIRLVMLKLRLAAGPAGQGAERHVRLTVTNDLGEQSEEYSFANESELLIPTRLSAGRNTVSLEVLDVPVAHASPDPRPLMVQLAHFAVAPFEGGQAGPAQHPLVVMDPEISRQAFLSPQLSLPEWGVEMDQNRSWVWLGNGSQQGLGGTINSLTALPVRFKFNVVPGPARADSRRTLTFKVRTAKGETLRESRRIDKKGAVVFRTRLDTGVNQFSLEVEEPATVRLETDRRPLLLYVTDVRVTS